MTQGRTADRSPMQRRFVEIGGQPLAYAETGEGPPVVLIHGTLTALDDMALALFDPLRRRHRVIAVDRPGFGLSGRDWFSGAGVLRQAWRIGQALDRLDVQRPVVVGHSFGGAVAVAMAALRPESVAGVVSLAPLVLPELRLEHWIFGPRAWPGSGAWLAATAHESFDQALLPVLWRGMFSPQPMPAAVERRFPFELAGAADATMRVGEDCLAAGPDLMTLLALMSSLRVPLEVLGGDQDLVVDNHRHGRLLAALAPRGRFTALPGVGHMIHHAAPERVVQLVGCMMEPRTAEVAVR